jgi:hypothetical protein
LIIGIQFWRQPARECVTSAEVDRRSIVQRCRSRTHTEAQCVGVVSDRCVILQLVSIESVERVSDLSATPDERVQNIQTGMIVLSSTLSISRE